MTLYFLQMQSILTTVELEMHWSHDEDFILDKRDTQTIVEQHESFYMTNTIKTKE